jgi:hypothetical protein
VVYIQEASFFPWKEKKNALRMKKHKNSNLEHVKLLHPLNAIHLFLMMKMKYVLSILMEINVK